MLGIIFMAVSMFFKEIFDSLGKYEVSNHRQSIYTLGFLSMFWGAIIFIITAFVRHSFVFSFASLSTLGIRIPLEVLQIYAMMRGIAEAERGSYNLVRTGTIPLILVADLILGYSISSWQIFGICIIFISLAILFLNHGISKKGLGWAALSTANGTITISLFKYDITYFNSVEAEQLIIYLTLLIYLIFAAKFHGLENPIFALKKPLFFFQSVSSGFAELLASFAFVFTAASIATTSQRSFSVLWGLIFGAVYFKEKELSRKIISLVLIGLGLILLV